jgi:hypothetical protein
MRTPAVALLAALAICAPAHAAPKPLPQITDPAGDATAMGPRYDVVSGLFATTGVTTKVRGRRVYTPTKLVVTVTYAGAVAADSYSTQVVSFKVPGCGGVYLEMFGGQTYGGADCLDAAFVFGAVRTGSTLTVTLPFATLGKGRLGRGVELGELTTWTNVADPQYGYETGDLLDPDLSVDVATTAKTYVVR